MCSGCMDIVTVIHDPQTVTDPFLGKSVMESLRQAVFIQKKVHIKPEEMAVFFLVLGGELLVWEDNNG